MFVIIEGDGDIDYMCVYGPFATQEEASAMLEDAPDEATSEYQYRVEEIQSPSKIEFN